MAVERDESADVSVLKNFMRNLEGGKTKFDAEVDDVQILFLFDDNTDAENALDMKIYENQDPIRDEQIDRKCLSPCRMRRRNPSGLLVIWIP